ncbi:MAG: hypothetical protein ACK4VP_03685 [Nitrospira sp.]
MGIRMVIRWGLGIGGWVGVPALVNAADRDNRLTEPGSLRNLRDVCAG